MQIDVLGPLEVRDDAGRPVEVAGSRLRTLLIRLALDGGRSVSVSALVDAVWGDHPPADETNALQTLVSRLRRAFGDTGVVVQSQAGYRLAVEPEVVDAYRFEELAVEGARALRRGEHRAAGQLLAAATAMWRGPALADTASEALQTYATRLEDVRLGAVLDRIEADLDLADPTVLLPELEALAAEHPLHERLAGQLMRALGASGRQADAIGVYERLRGRLAEELGVDPGKELQEIHVSLLRGEFGGRRQPRAHRRTNLKAQLTSFVGRDDEVVRIGKSLEGNRLVTLVGPGGAGKTRLASEAAARIVDTAADGIWLVELAQVTAGADVPQAVLGSLGLRDTHLLDRRGKLSARDAVTRLLEGLADTETVLVLDNCEHVIDASATLADRLLAECPELRILTTSREPLGIFGEVLLAVPPLGQPAPTASPAEAMEYPAVRLFADRAAAVRPDFEVKDDAAPAVIEIVRRLDGLPLAIELAAARLRTLPLDEIAARLSDRFRLLTGGSRTALPRHRTLRAVVEWSWDLLTDAERRLAEQLAVFPSGITADSAIAVSDTDAADGPDLLASLIDKSLLHPVDDGRRMRMLETIREYGAERLAERGELATVRARHADHFAALMTEAEPYLTTAGQLPWLTRLEDERENVLAALRYRCELGDADGALRLAISIASYAMMLGNHTEIASWMGDALAVPGPQDRQLRLMAEALLALTTAASGVAASDVQAGMDDLRRLAHQLVDFDTSVSRFIGILRAAVAYFAGEMELANRFIDETLAGDDEWSRAAVRMFRGSLAENQGDVETMRREIGIALGEFRRIGERWGLASTLRGVAQLHTLDGRLDEARDAYVEALGLAAELNTREDESFLLGRLADVELRRGDLDKAREHMLRARQGAEETGAPWESVFTMAMLGAIELQSGNPAEARSLQREALRRVSSMPTGHPAQGHLRAILLAIGARISYDDGDLEAARQLGRDGFDAAIGTRDMPIVAAVGVMLAEIVTAAGDPDGAAVMLGAAARLRGADDPTSRDIAKLTERLRAALGDARFADCYAQGKALDRDAAIERLTPPDVSAAVVGHPQSSLWFG
ncbi:MAG TPA: BTAD domain-containing putative transcriptional regulator [Jatrophihabitans sp.]|nr:BTAD domain-containing putative transcriptional regulator [Jatrophihabitans sp.]